jgi:hypothetical protein
MEYYELMPTVYHEAMHQYLHSVVGEGVGIPIWFDEGMAEYFEGIQEDKKTRKLDAKLIDKRKMRMVQDKIRTRTVLPLEKLIGATHEDFHDKDRETQYYNQSFAVVYYLMQSSGGKLVHDYIQELKGKRGIQAANEKLFGKDLKKLKQFEASWKAYISKLQVEVAKS